jgi:hypothetical protein
MTRLAAASTWAPLWLLVGSALLIAAPTFHRPARLALNLLPYTVLFVLAWWGLGRAARPRARNACLLAVAVLCIVPARAGRARIEAPARARPDSPVLWSATLQHPDQAIRRFIRLPAGALARGVPYRLVVRLERAYRGPASLLATVNGVPLGRPAPMVMPGQGETTPADEDWGLPAPAAVLALRPITEVVITQDRPDPALRIITSAGWAGATLGPDAAWFFDGQAWHRGAVHPQSGEIVPGLPHVWLAPEA